MAGKSEYKNNWLSENRERVTLVLIKGKKDIIKAHADKRGESLNAFVNRAIDEAMKRDNAEDQQAE